MGVQIDEPGRDDHAPGIDLATTGGGGDAADRANAAANDADIGPPAWSPRSVDEHSAPNDDVELRHGFSVLLGAAGWRQSAIQRSSSVWK
jgi:hypothetical protein